MNQISTSTGDALANPESRIPNPAPAQRGTLYIVAAPSGAGKSSIVNDVFEAAVEQMHAIFTASRLRREAQDMRHAGLIAALLAE